jgi:hypothetical protein
MKKDICEQCRKVTDNKHGEICDIINCKWRHGNGWLGNAFLIAIWVFLIFTGGFALGQSIKYLK